MGTQQTELATGSCFWRHQWSKWAPIEGVDRNGVEMACQARRCARCGKIEVEAFRP